MNIQRWALVGACMLLLLPGCNTQGDEGSPSSTTGLETTFELSGDVSAVDIEDVDFNLSIPPDGFDIDADAGITVNVTVNLESIDDATAELCDLQPGIDALVVVTDETDLDFDRPLTELGSLEDESIRVKGTAVEKAAVQSPGQGTTEPAGKCILQAEEIGLVEEGTPQATPTATPSPLPDIN